MTDFAKLVLDADTRGLKDAERDLDSVAMKAGDVSRNVGRSMMKLGAGLTAGVTAPLGLFGKGAVEAAIDAQEMEGAFSVVFGNMADDVRAWAETTGDSLGRSTQEMQRGALAFQELFGKALAPEQAAELSKEFSVLTQDLASFKNLSNEVAQQKLFSGLTGEAEPLRAVGVFINDAAVKAKALELGLGDVSGALTDQDKIVARSALIREQLADAQGDVLRTADGTANQIKKSQAAYEELQVTIGTKLLPILTPMIEKLGAAFEWFATLPDPIQNTALVVAGASAALGPLLLVIGSIVTIAPAIATAFGVIKVAALGLLANPVLLGAAAVIGGIYLAWQNWDEIKAIVSGVGDAVSSFWNDNVSPAFTGLKDGLIDTGKVWLDWHLQAIGYAQDTGEAVGTWIGDRLGAVWTGLVENLQRSGRAFFDMHVIAIQAMADLGAGIFAKVREIASSMLQAGRDIIGGLVAGIRAAPGAVFNALEDVVMGGVDGIKNLLGIQSPSRLFMAIGGFMTEGMAIGIQNGKESVDAAIYGLGDGLDALQRKSEAVTVRVADTFADMANKTLAALDRVAGAVQGGGFFDILSSVVGLGIQLGSSGVFGSGVADRLNSTPGRANGGAVSAGQSYLVGENRPEIFTPQANGFITPRAANDTGGEKVVVINNSSMADVYVDGRIQKAAPAVANAGANLAGSRMARMQSRTTG